MKFRGHRRCRAAPGRTAEGVVATWARSWRL